MSNLLGIHTIRNGRTLDFVKQGVVSNRPLPVVKSVDNMGILTEVKQHSPKTITIARFTGDNLEELSQNPSPNLDSLAASLFDPYYRTREEERQYVDYWEICNEPDPPSVEGYANLAQVMIRCMAFADSIGIKLVLFGFNSGTPEWTEMVALARTGVFHKAVSGGHWVSFHEGVFGDTPIWAGYGGIIPFAPVVAWAGPYCFRYRYMAEAARQAGTAMPGVVISEFYPGSTKISPALLVDRYAWAENHYSDDPYVKAILPFTLGPDDNWRESDYDFAYPLLMERIMGHYHVTANALNVRAFPWVGVIVPPVIRQYTLNTPLTVFGVYKPEGFTYGWGCISPNGDLWVSMKYMAAGW